MYKDISSNKWKSSLLIFLFILFIVGLAVIFGYTQGDPLLYIIPAIVISFITSFIGYYKSDSLVLSISGAKKVKEIDNPELFHTLENLCISTGMPMPKLYVINDPAPNAFATGRDPAHSAIAVTTGLISKLKKIEMEGVLAHELSHIKNYDIRLATLVVVFVGIVVLMSDWFLRISFYGRNRNEKGDGRLQLILLIAGIMLAILSPLFAQLIHMAISRKREYLADATGALMTRYPEGLARALEKISSDTHKLKRANKATAHLYIENPLKDFKKSFLNNLFSTHPPIEKRVKKLRGMGI